MDLNCGVTSIGAQCIATLFNKVLTAVCYEGGQNDSAHSKSSFEAGVELSANLSGRAGLRSAKRGDLAVPRTATELGMGFPTSHPPRFYVAPNFLKMGVKMHRGVVF